MRDSLTEAFEPPTIFGLLRHGTTLWNETGKIQGRMNSPLSAKGIEQVTDYSKKLKAMNWQRIIASSLGRAKQTVGIVQLTLSLPVTFFPALAEQHWGLWQGKTIAEIDTLFPGQLEKQVALGWEFCPPEGESRRQVYDRASKILAEAASCWPGKKILVVCHEGVIKSLVYHLAKRSFLPSEKKILQKNQLHILIHQEGELKLQQVNAWKT